MTSAQVADVLVGIYLGLLAGIFPAFIAFSIGFGFKYFTDVTMPGLGVVVLGGALAGVSGGLMGLVDPQLADSWTGITAVLVILMACLWAHGQGDKLGAATPRKLTLKSIRESRLSADLVERVDSYGQIQIRPVGEILDVEGYPPLPDSLRETLHEGSWKFPASLSLAELESRLEERLLTEYELAAVTVAIDEQGRAEVAAAPSAAGLSRRVPPGQRAVSIRTLLPSGVARGDSVTIRLPDGPVTGPVVSARTEGDDTVSTQESPGETAGMGGDESANVPPSTPPAPTTTGGEGRITIALSAEDARRVIRAEFAPVIVHSRGKQREYEAIGVLKAHGNRFRKVTIGASSNLAGGTIGSERIRDTYGVAVLAIRRSMERIVAPDGDAELTPGDALIIVGRPSQLRAFEEVAQ
ncbi:cation:proton antiporter regulatory subunit [Natranaeroarchaeum aerophilus]|uniref:TrkA C-terminal domain-containing protein n=1 Tax=Natranaeroarchaeum aerophilus TaxID=2917711 RepID=A0AAE3K2Q0_9EURY|nr:TrkA C-terminal domain-containing protein [Natranaeroarchaeum aerophilus]MCL9812112.1 TrkA C-terminal domain-containing protein [Natranaeroarchaeum aerophilus]